MLFVCSEDKVLAYYHKSAGQTRGEAIVRYRLPSRLTLPSLVVITCKSSLLLRWCDLVLRTEFVKWSIHQTQFIWFLSDRSPNSWYYAIELEKKIAKFHCNLNNCNLFFADILVYFKACLPMEFTTMKSRWDESEQLCCYFCSFKVKTLNTCEESNPFTPSSDQPWFSLSVSHQRYIIQYGEFGNR